MVTAAAKKRAEKAESVSLFAETTIREFPHPWDDIQADFVVVSQFQHKL
jgi:hypothetical protein